MFDPDTIALRAHNAVGTLWFALQGYGQVLDRLQAAGAAGETIEADGLADLTLARDIATLRNLAAELEQRRAALIRNATPRFTLVAARR